MKVSLDAELLEEAKRLDVDVSLACQQGLAAQIAEANAKRWLDKNKDALAAANDFVERHGLPLAHRRLF